MAIKRPRSDWRKKLAGLRQRFILTREEKKVIVFVFAAFVLGVGAKCYRDAHPQAPPSFDIKHPWRKYQTSPTPSSSPQKAPTKSRKKKPSASPPQNGG